MSDWILIPDYMQDMWDLWSYEVLTVILYWWHLLTSAASELMIQTCPAALMPLILHRMVLLVMWRQLLPPCPLVGVSMGGLFTGVQFLTDPPEITVLPVRSLVSSTMVGILIHTEIYKMGACRSWDKTQGWVFLHHSEVLSNILHPAVIKWRSQQQGDPMKWRQIWNSHCFSAFIPLRCICCWKAGTRKRHGQGPTLRSKI